MIIVIFVLYKWAGCHKLEKISVNLGMFKSKKFE